MRVFLVLVFSFAFAGIAFAQEVDEAAEGGPATGDEVVAAEEIPHKEAVKFTALQIDYPSEAFEPEIVEGYCEIRFDIRADGRTRNVEAVCTKSIFCETSLRALKTARVDTDQIANGKIDTVNIIYPIEFRIEGSGLGKPERTPLLSCQARLIS